MRPRGFVHSQAPPADHPSLTVRTVQQEASASLLAAPGVLRFPAQVALFRSRRLERALESELQEFQPQVVVLVLSRLGTLASCLEGWPVVVDLVDSLALNMHHRALRAPLWQRPFWHWEARRMSSWERQLASWAGHSTVVSERDRAALCEHRPELQQRISVVPFGVELPQQTRSAVEQPIMLLSGNLGYFPTYQGARWLYSQVWPRVRERLPQAQWWLAGSRVPREMRAWAGQDGIRLLEQPSDLASVRQQCAVSVAPLFAGSGTPIKILEAMAEELPVVATPMAVEGLDGLQGGEVSVAAVAEDFASQLVRLLSEPPRAAEQARKARQWLDHRHGLATSAGAFEQVLLRVAENRSEQP